MRWDVCIYRWEVAYDEAIMALGIGHVWDLSRLWWSDSDICCFFVFVTQQLWWSAMTCWCGNEV